MTPNCCSLVVQVSKRSLFSSNQKKGHVKWIVSLLQIPSYFSHCFKKWRDFTFACVKNSFRMQIRIMVGDDITHTHGFFPIDFRILGKKKLPGRVPDHARYPTVPTTAVPGQTCSAAPVSSRQVDAAAMARVKKGLRLLAHRRNGHVLSLKLSFHPDCLEPKIRSIFILSLCKIVK